MVQLAGRGIVFTFHVAESARDGRTERNGQNHKREARMATGKLLRQLIKSGLEGNQEAFRAASEQVIQEERQKQHHLLANDLERLLYGRPKELVRSAAR